MKKVIILFLIMTTYLFSQSWNSIVTTTINEPNLVKMDLFTNKDGNHIIVQNSNSSNSIKYYLLNSSGTVVRSSTIETSGGAEFPNISGDNDKIYVVYKIGSNLRVRKSTNAGQSWITSIVDKDIGNNTCNGVDIVYGYGALHVVYAMQDNGSNYETYYRRISSDTWGSREDVTGYGTEVGGFPTVTVSPNRVHVSYNTGNGSTPYSNFGDAKTRDKYYSTWQAPKPVTQGDEESAREKVQVRTTTLYDFYYEPWVDLGQFGYHLIVKTKPISSGNWSGHTQLDTYTADPWPFMGAEQTADNNLNIVYLSDDAMNHRSFDGTNWSAPFEITNDFLYYTNLGYSTVSNDLYVSWKPHGSNYIKYRQYDASPLVPQNFDVGVYQTQYDSYPKLTWALNDEPDVRENNVNGYLIERKIKFGNFQQIAAVSGQISEYIDYDVHYAGSGPNTAEYRIRANDVNNHPSGYTPIVSINWGNAYKKGNMGETKVMEYSLS